MAIALQCPAHQFHEVLLVQLLPGHPLKLAYSKHKDHVLPPALTRHPDLGGRETCNVHGVGAAHEDL